MLFSTVVEQVLEWLEGRGHQPAPPSALELNNEVEAEWKHRCTDDDGDDPPPSPYDWDSPTAQAVKRLLEAS
jgi:hypothetical protein